MVNQQEKIANYPLCLAICITQKSDSVCGSPFTTRTGLFFLFFLNSDSFLTVMKAVSYLFAQKSVLFLEGIHCGGGKGGVSERGGGDGGGRWDPVHHCKTCNKCYWTSRSRRDHIRYKLSVISVEKHSSAR